MGLVADDDHEASSEVGVGEGAAVLVGADDAIAVGVGVLDDRTVAGHPQHRQGEERTGAGPHRLRVVGVGGVPGDHERGRTERVR